jgi:hypothetical protein
VMAVAGGENGHLASGAIDRGNARPIQGPYLIGRDPIPHRVRRSRVGRVAEVPIRRDHCIFDIAAGICRRLNRLCSY